MSGAVTVTQADRDLAADWTQSRSAAAGIRSGKHDDHSFVRAAASHRQSAEAASSARLSAALEMAEDYHAAHIEQRTRAQKAEADLAASRDREAALVKALEDIRDANQSSFMSSRGFAAMLQRLAGRGLLATHRSQSNAQGEGA